MSVVIEDVDLSESGTDLRWQPVCSYDSLTPDRPAAVMIGGRQVALVRLAGGTVHAMANADPASGANVIARGLVGSRGAARVIISPMYKHAFDLADGKCLDDPTLTIPLYPTRIVAGIVEVMH